MPQPRHQTEIAASDLRDLCAGRWRDVWLRRKGLVERPDLSKVFSVQMGIVTEPLNRAWSGNALGLPIWERAPDGVGVATQDERGVLWVRPGLWRGRPDGCIAGRIPFEAKFTGTSGIEAFRELHWPQAMVYCDLWDAPGCVLGVIDQGPRHTVAWLPADPAGIEALREIAEEFLDYMAMDIMPEDRDPVYIEHRPIVVGAKRVRAELDLYVKTVEVFGDLQK
jgi:hypothetical protein